jgi:hypothetical protein
VRNASEPDEEFGNFAAHDEYPDCIGTRDVGSAERRWHRPTDVRA